MPTVVMPGSGDDVLRTTGGQVDGIVLALIDSSYDKNDVVTSAICKSLFSIGKHQPNLVLSSCHSYLQRHPKLPLAHKILILGVVEHVSTDALNSIKTSVALDLIKLAIEEMVNTKEIVPEWQSVASGILVSLGRKFHNDVMEHLLVKFQPGVLPHFFVIQTMANLSSANVFGMVPFLKAILGTTLPLLCMVKQENMKWIFAYALARFCEAILEYVANVEKAPDPTVTKEAFSSEISSAYDVLFNNWLQSREAKVRSEVVEALGHMTHLLSTEKLEELLPKFIPAVLAMYKRHQEFQHTTQGLCMVLDAAVSNKCIALESQLDNILNTLFPQICTLPDYSQPSGVRNHNEVLRCFAVLAPMYSDRLVNFLLLRLEYNNESSRIGALTVLKHLINSCELYTAKKMTHIISGLKCVLDSGNKVKKVIAQVIVALAHHGHLESDGGVGMVWFIVSQCALPDEPLNKRPTDSSHVSNEALRGMCENVIHLLTTTVEKMQNVLWPNMLDCLLSENLTSAVSPVCKSLAFLAGKKRDELGPDFDIEYSSLTNVTSPQLLLARLLVMIGYPHDGRDRGIHILRLLKSVAPAVNKSLKALWDTKIPVLITVLESTDVLDWNQQLWETHVTEFVVSTLEEVDREEWTLKLGKALQGQLPLYASSPTDKYIALRILGLVMKKVINKNFINQALDSIFENVNHFNSVERLGCAVAAGYCGATHLDIVLVKLEQVAKDDKKNAGLFSFIKDFKGDSDHEKLKATIILCYGYVTVNGPIPILSTRIETPILRSVANFYQSSRDPLVKQSMLETVKLIAESVHPKNLKEAFTFRSRSELLNLMKSILKTESAGPLTSSIRSLALSASASLVALDPVLQSEEKNSLIQVAVGSVYSLPRDCFMQKLNNDTTEINMDFDQLLFSTVDSLNLLLQQFLLKERSPKNLEAMFWVLHGWTISKHDVERERCMHSSVHLLQCYVQSTESDAFSLFTTLGSILGILVPRCTDPQITVRHLAFDSIDTLLAIALRVQAPMSRDTEEKCGASLSYLKQQIISDDPSSLFTVTKDLGKLVSEKLPVEQICPFLLSLINGLGDPHSQSSSGASVVLNSVIKLRGREIRQEIPVILDALRHKLEAIQCPHTRKGALRSIQNMAHHHLSAILSSLLNSPLPLDTHTVDIWKTLAQEESLANLVTDHCLELLSDNILSTPPDPHGRSAIYVAVLKPLVAVCALREVFRIAEMEKCGKGQFDRIFAVLLLVIGAYVGAAPPSHTVDDGKASSITFSKKAEQKLSQISPIRCAIEALKNFLICVKEDIVVSSLTEGGYWILMEDMEKYPEAVAALGRSLCICCPNYIPRIVAYLNPMLNSSIEVQRIVTIALFVEFLSQSYKGRHTLTEPLMNNLLGRLVDSSHIVRRLCVHGLGCIGTLDKEQVQRYSTTILSAMMAGMDEKEDPGCEITLEAMSGLSMVLSQIAEQDVRGILINIALRVKPMFEKEKPLVRAEAFTLFGNLSRFCNGPSKEPFIEQIHNNMVPLLLHLNDTDKHVVKSCKYALRLLGPLLDSQDMNSMFQKHLLDDAHLHYGEFINDLTKTIIADFPDQISSYATTSMSFLRSPFSVIQCNATAFLGYLLGNLSVDQHQAIPKERICAALILLLKDQSLEVRIRAAESLSLLYDY